MPTIILYDVSLSMCRTINLSDTSENYTYQNLANYGLIELLDYMSINSKMEYVSLMYYSSLWERNVNFTRDYETIKHALAKDCGTFYDTTNIENALIGVQEYVLEEWGNKIPIQILLITDGQPGISVIYQMHSSNDNKIASLDENKPNENSFVHFSFPCKFHIINLCTKADHHMYDEALLYYKRLIIETCSTKTISLIDDQIHFLESYSLQSVSNLFKKLANKYYMPFKSTLHCGSLSSPITIFPAIERYTDNNSDMLTIAEPLDFISIYGFLELNEVASPPIHSRHIIFPNFINKDQLHNFHSILTINTSFNYELNSSTLTELEEAKNAIYSDESKQPSLCVLLHGSLKVESAIAICKIGEPNWFGMLYSWADNKKKSNLMLSTFKCGLDSIDWLGNLMNLGLSHLSTKLNPSELTKYGERKSYLQSCVVWIKQTALHSDIQKVLRLAKKLPDKTVNFYKELTKFKKAALTTGFYGILQGMATILERECTLLPGTAHPEAALQLTHAVNALRAPCTPETINLPITPLKTRFNAD